MYPPRSDARGDTKRGRLRGLPQDRRHLGPPASLHDLWACRVLRSVQEQARCSPSPSGDRLTRPCDTMAGGRVARPVSWVSALWCQGGRDVQIHLIEKDQAGPLVQRIYDALERQAGSVTNFNKMLAHKPEVLRALNQ